VGQPLSGLDDPEPLFASIQSPVHVVKRAADPIHALGKGGQFDADLCNTGINRTYAPALTSRRSVSTTSFDSLLSDVIANSSASVSSVRPRDSA